MKCKKCGAEISDKEYRCTECGEPMEKNLECAYNPKKGRGKKILLIVLLFILVSGLMVVLGIFINRQTYVEPQTTEEQKPKSKVAEMVDYIKGDLEEEGYTEVLTLNYYNFQDFVNGAKNYPDEYFFIGTTNYSWSTIYSDTKFYKNKDAIESLDKWGMTNSTYLFVFEVENKDKYGKMVHGLVFVPVEYTDYESDQWDYWIVPMFEADLCNVVLETIAEKCEPHLVE